ncbi:GIY-YIG nuclease family protein [Rugosimonospora africana]|uniref:Bacteriophage T5 Orf172 DNA-binding domain-containing protein n=1 Tax=Rugosimonospora africana TaxID=556532 RepID=A0A8J3VVP7_9ACTN|nr:GIY-YIG nuclease family protein [Rugosimonospora africana]GIH20892.1 hypothetical protein Raf01_90640 [Rugosimonospora africana]
MNRREERKRIDELRRNHRGSVKDILTDPAYPPDDPHNIPGVYFIVQYADWVNGGKPYQVKIGKSDDPRRRLADLQTGNPAELDLAHVIYAPDSVRRHALETDLQHSFRHLHVVREWFSWCDELSDYISTSCREQCWERWYL